MLLFSCTCDIRKMGKWHCYRVLFFSYGVLLCLVGNSALCLILSDCHIVILLMVVTITVTATFSSTVTIYVTLLLQSMYYVCYEVPTD